MQQRVATAMKRRVVAARNPVLTAKEERRKSGDDAVEKGQEGSQTAAAHARQQHQSQDTQQQQQSQKISEAIAAAADAAVRKGGTIAQNTAAEDLQLRAEVQQLRAQLHHEKRISQGLLGACRQPEVVAAAKRKQNTAAEAAEVPEWAGKCAQLRASNWYT